MKDKVKFLLSTVLEYPLENIDDQFSMNSAQEWDSLKQINLILALEEEYSTYFDDEEIMSMTSLNGILKVLSSRP